MTLFNLLSNATCSLQRVKLYPGVLICIEYFTNLLLFDYPRSITQGAYIFRLTTFGAESVIISNNCKSLSMISVTALELGGWTRPKLFVQVYFLAYVVKTGKNRWLAWHEVIFECPKKLVEFILGRPCLHNPWPGAIDYYYSRWVLLEKYEHDFEN